MTEYRAFFATYRGVTDELTTPATIIPLITTDPKTRGTPFKIGVLWDTGATSTCVKPALWERLKLRPLESGRTKLMGVGGSIDADVTFVDLLLASKMGVTCCPIYKIDFPGNVDMLIGMDIVRMGDFAVCNNGDKTSFSFVIPPFPDRINFIDKAEAIKNRRCGV